MTHKKGFESHRIKALFDGDGDGSVAGSACGHEGVGCSRARGFYGMASRGRSEGSDAASLVEVRSDETRVPASFLSHKRRLRLQTKFVGG